MLKGLVIQTQITAEI